jgi:hypothetical protein
MMDVDGKDLVALRRERIIETDDRKEVPHLGYKHMTRD